jgi:hypothetical protein
VGTQHLYTCRGRNGGILYARRHDMLVTQGYAGALAYLLDQLHSRLFCACPGGMRQFAGLQP